MSRHHIIIAASVACLAACSDSTAPANGLSPRGASLAERGRALPERAINILDKCDPATFNAAVGPGTCLRTEAGITFTDFIGQLSQLHNVPAWRFEPGSVTLTLGQGFVATNFGGEVHTFTEVKRFGGGIVPLLNQASGITEVAPECTALATTDFLPRGAKFHDTPDEVGTELYQCCIHPWMRAVVRIHS